MRPAQKAPENSSLFIFPIPILPGFNEAGAKSAGKRVRFSTVGGSTGLLQ